MVHVSFNALTFLVSLLELSQGFISALDFLVRRLGMLVLLPTMALIWLNDPWHCFGHRCSDKLPNCLLYVFMCGVYADVMSDDIAIEICFGQLES